MNEAGEATTVGDGRRASLIDRLLSGSPQDRALSLLSWLIVIVGGLVQIYNFLGARSLRQDEAFIALNVRHLSFSELLGPLDYGQVAPVGWLLGEKLLDGLTGRYEYDLRLISLLAGLGALLAFRHLAARTTRGAGFLCAVALFACSVVFVRFAADAKPYALDVLFSCLILAIGLHMLTTARPRLWAWAGFLVVGCAAPFLSFPAVYMLFGAGSVVFLKKAFEKDWRAAGATAVICVAWLAAFVAMYIVFAAPQAAGTSVTTGLSQAFFETGYFAPLPPHSLKEAAWYVTMPKSILYYFFGGMQFAVAGLIAVGLFYGVQRDRWLLLLLLTPALAAVIGSGLKLYPLFERLTLFLLPTTILLAGMGMTQIAVRARNTAAVAVLLLAAAGPSAWELAGELARRPPFAMQEMQPVLKTLAQKVKPGDVVYVTRTSAPAFLTYQQDAGLAGVRWVRGLTDGRWNCVIDELPVVAPGDTLWILVTDYGREPWNVQGNDVEWRARGIAADMRLETEDTNVWLYRATMTPTAVGEAPQDPDPRLPVCPPEYERSERTTARAQAALTDTPSTRR